MREIFIFVGENRSKTAQELDASWWKCQQTGKPVLSAIRLWDAFDYLKLDPNKQIFFNLWNDNWKLNKDVPKTLRMLAENGEIIVGMGKKVQRKLDELDIVHRKLIHPAARGKIAAKILYRKHVKTVLSS